MVLANFRLPDINCAIDCQIKKLNRFLKRDQIFMINFFLINQSL